MSSNRSTPLLFLAVALMLALVSAQGCYQALCDTNSGVECQVTYIVPGQDAGAPPVDAGPPPVHLTCEPVVPVCPAFNVVCDNSTECCKLSPPGTDCSKWKCEPCCIDGTTGTVNVCVD